MQRDEIIEMARQAGFIGNVDIAAKELETFVKLVEAKERDHCATRAAIALLGANKALSDRVLHAITHRKSEA